MKHILIVACLFVAVYGLSQEFQEKSMDRLMNIAEICVPEVGANDDDIKELMEKKVPSRKEGKCLMACFSKKLGIMKDGKPNKEGSLVMLEPLKAEDPQLYAQALKVLDKCAAEFEKVTETDECELAVIGSICVHKAGDELGIDAESVMGRR